MKPLRSTRSPVSRDQVMTPVTTASPPAGERSTGQTLGLAGTLLGRYAVPTSDSPPRVLHARGSKSKTKVWVR